MAVRAATTYIASMSIRGQSPDAWIARWRKGTCPVHGVGFPGAPDGPFDGSTTARCSREECPVVVAFWRGKDARHAKLGLVDGPDDVRAALTKALEIDGAKPGRRAVDVRTSWPLEPE